MKNELGDIMNIKKVAIIEIDKPRSKKQHFLESISDFYKGLLFLGGYLLFILLLIYIYDIIIY